MSQLASELTIYDRMGGEAAVRAAVDRFYERVLADPELQGFFTSVSMPRLKAHQLAFLSQVLGGPRQYSGASMRDAHSRLAIEQRHFDGVAVHLVETLRELGGLRRNHRHRRRCACAIVRRDRKCERSTGHDLKTSRP